MDPSYKQTLSPGAVFATALTQVPAGPTGAAPPGALEATHAVLSEPGQHLVFSDGETTRVERLVREWTRIGRSLAADIRFDDPTVSRRHALIVRQADGVRVLDDRSLNGVFVNGERVEWRALAHGDEIVVGRYRLLFADIDEAGAESAPASLSSGRIAG